MDVRQLHDQRRGWRHHVAGHPGRQVALVEGAGVGRPLVVAAPESAVALAYREVARAMVEQLTKRPRAAMSIASSLV